MFNIRFKFISIHGRLQNLNTYFITVVRSSDTVKLLKEIKDNLNDTYISLTRFSRNPPRNPVPPVTHQVIRSLKRPNRALKRRQLTRNRFQSQQPQVTQVILVRKMKKVTLKLAPSLIRFQAQPPIRREPVRP